MSGALQVVGYLGFTARYANVAARGAPDPGCVKTRCFMQFSQL
jgi:hypothetical protein